MRPENFRVPASGTEPEPTNDREAVHFSHRWDSNYGAKCVLDLPAPWEDEDAKEVIKEFEWVDVHYEFDKHVKNWRFDLSELNDVITAYTDAGYDVTVSISLAKEFESYKRGRYTFLPQFRNKANA